MGCCRLWATRGCIGKDRACNDFTAVTALIASKHLHEASRLYLMRKDGLY